MITEPEVLRDLRRIRIDLKRLDYFCTFLLIRRASITELNTLFLRNDPHSVALHAQFSRDQQHVRICVERRRDPHARLCREERFGPLSGETDTLDAHALR